MNRPPHVIEAEVYALRTDEGGRRNPRLTGYRPSHNFGKNGHLNDGLHEYPSGGRIELGASGVAYIWLLAPDENYGLLSIGDPFTVQEGNRIVGRGRITALPNAKLQKQPANNSPEAMPGQRPPARPSSSSGAPQL
jgi:translation elongation factor EF-Tu-like GTPase